MEEKNSHLFYMLVYSFQVQGMMGMGKIKNPVTDKTEVDLDASRMAIDMLDMLSEISKGNISDDENKFLQDTLRDLKLNFIEEQNKSKEQSPAGENKTDEQEKKES
jgi:hypothetical protein